MDLDALEDHPVLRKEWGDIAANARMILRDHAADTERLMSSALKVGAQEAILATLRTLRRMGHHVAADDLTQHHAMVIRQAVSAAGEKR